MTTHQTNKEASDEHDYDTACVREIIRPVNWEFVRADHIFRLTIVLE